MPTTPRRVAITGIGCVSPLGLSATSTWAAMVAGQTGIRPLDLDTDVELTTPIIAKVSGFDGANHFDRRSLRMFDRSTQFALVATDEALAHAALDFTQKPELRARCGVILGTANGGETSRDLAFRTFYRDPAPQLDPLTVLRIMPSAPASHITIRHGLTGPAWMVSSACSSSNHAFAQALQCIRHGQADIVLAGGVEASLAPGFIKAWEAMRVLADDTCRPFSAGRRGLVLGEGAAVFVLEAYEVAQQRGAYILAELAGAGITCDARDMVRPDAIGAAAAMRAALNDALTPAYSVDYINAHGTGTPANDVMETRAIRDVFGEQSSRLLVSSTKSVHGHLIGAAGAVELIAAVGAIRDGIIPPTMNVETQDPECDLDIVRDAPRRQPVRVALSNSFAFGGMNAVIVVKQPHE
jgi:nodulation protein E